MSSTPLIALEHVLYLGGGYLLCRAKTHRRALTWVPRLLGGPGSG